MPIHVDIRVNSHLVQTIHIGRIKGEAAVDSLNTYKVVSGDQPGSAKEWLDGTTFTHLYSDPIEVCVKKALDALIGKDSMTEEELEEAYRLQAMEEENE